MIRLTPSDDASTRRSAELSASGRLTRLRLKPLVREFLWRGGQSLRRLALALGLGASLFLLSCASVEVEQYRAEKPILDLKRYLNGDLRAWGMFTDRFGKVQRRFEVRMKASWKGSQGILEEDFLYSDGTKERRVWTIDEIAPGRFRGRADDVIGEAVGESAGNALNWRYTLALPIEGRTWHVQFDDWMYLIDEQVLINRAKMSKFGIELGEVTLSFSRESRP